MKQRTKLVIFLGLVLSLVQAKADLTITLDNGTTGQPGNDGQGTIGSWLGGVNGLVATYNAAHPGVTLPTSVGSELFRVNVPGANQTGYSVAANKLSITVPTGAVGDYDYLVLHWGGPGGGEIQAFYIGKDTGSITFNSPFQNGQQHALSWYDGFEKIVAAPEPTTLLGGALLLLPLGASAMGRWRRNRAVS